MVVKKKAFANLLKSEIKLNIFLPLKISLYYYSLNKAKMYVSDHCIVGTIYV